MDEYYTQVERANLVRQCKDIQAALDLMNWEGPFLEFLQETLKGMEERIKLIDEGNLEIRRSKV